MSWEKPLFHIGELTAAANYSSANQQFTFMYTTGGGKFKKQTTNGGWVLGVLQDTPSSGVAGNIMVQGVTKVRVTATSHAAIVPGDKLCCSTAGAAIPSTAVTKYAIGRALEALGANTTGIIAMLITHQGAGSSAAAAGV